MKKVDLSRPYAERFGHCEDGVRYEQDGLMFDSSGDEIVSKKAAPADGGATSKPGPKPRTSKKAAPADGDKATEPGSQVDDQLAAQLSA